MAKEDANGTRFGVLRTREHWLRSSHDDTALDARRNVVTLARHPPPRKPAPIDGDVGAARYAVAWDRCGRLYRSVPSAGRIERLHGGTIVPLFAGWLKRPMGIAIDAEERLYIADETAQRLIVIDLDAGHLVANLKVPDPGARPWDLALDATKRGVYLLDRGTRSVWHVTRDRAPIRLLGAGGAWVAPGQPEMRDPIAIYAQCDGAVVILDRPVGAGQRRLLIARPGDVREAPIDPGTDDLSDLTTFTIDADGDAIFGGDAKSTLPRFFLDGAEIDDIAPELHRTADLRAWGFDGGMVTRDPSGAVVFTTKAGVSAPAPAFPANFARAGSAVSFAIDSKIEQCVWHRVFVEACLPEHTAIEIETRTSDDPGPDEVPLPPQGFGAGDVRVVDGSPVAPPDAHDWTPTPHLLRRPAGADRPFYVPDYPDGTAMDLYEGIVFAPPGRYLWVRLTLRGTDRVTPSVAGMRVYYPRPSYLPYLPRVFRDDRRAAEFLDRLLTLFEAFHEELDLVRDHMRVLFEPQAVPEEALDWLAGWLGLVLDPRWPIDKRRRLVASARRLYKDRGTVAGLTAFLRIYLDHPFQLVEGFRTRQAGGVMVGAPPEVGESVIGAGLVLAAPDDLVAETARYAHRFTLYVAGELTPIERDVTERIIELEKPAHTLGEICDVTETLAVGQRALVGISTLVGRATCLTPSVLGPEGFPLGRDGVLGGAKFSERTMEIGTTSVGTSTSILR